MSNYSFDDDLRWLTRGEAVTRVNRISSIYREAFDHSDEATTRFAKDFVEIMTCLGGCAGGGGQPIFEGEERAEERAQVLYGLDKINELRFSHENPSVQKCYQDYFGSPLSHKSHQLLHTNQADWEMDPLVGIVPSKHR